ncbi:sulfur reduction protein DsrE [Heliobacillus mobilis]|uniref:Sulfur reduction protein DsrE n=1 Tax=Heliobacterium mobile TaxID=28064 RepID=A0A6I3SGH6_HELMO|nr:DsrE family protein [Heliobacterium mobile]MTV47929.1 sulfur reduction protein DsrE [Heliobacterium mobile]
MSKDSSFVVTLGFNNNNENYVTVALTVALAAQKKGEQACLLLLVDGVHLGKEGYVDDINIGEPFRPVRDLLADFLASGGQLKICGACLHHNKIANDELLTSAEIITGSDIVDLLNNAKSTLQLN